MTEPSENAPSRNDPCPCGSGRKYKRCHGDANRKPRERFVYFGYNEKPELAVDHRGQPVVDAKGLPIARLPSGELIKPDHVFTHTTYKGAGREKVVDSVHGVAAPNLPSYIASEFDVAFGIDTSTKESISVCCFIECEVPSLQIRPEFSWFPFKNCEPGLEERFGWSLVIGWITERPGYSNATRVALIVDHDLANHPKYQTREIAIYGDVFLPENFKLIYASADTGREGMNGLVSWCDVHSKRMLRQLVETGRTTMDGTISLDQILDLRLGQDPQSEVRIAPAAEPARLPPPA